jgi:hypothetical protein
MKLLSIDDLINSFEMTSHDKLLLVRRLLNDVALYENKPVLDDLAEEVKKVQRIL